MGLSAPQHALELGFRILIWIMYLWIETWTPFIRHIDEEELTLYRYPSVHSYVNKIYLHLIICCTPTIIFLFYYLIKRDENTIPDIINQFYGITLAYCLNALYTTTIKTTLGRPRPNFFLRCFPRWVRYQHRRLYW
ncbi:hypothetical protein NQ317_009811 [Molorchus minor]|uniref:Uncharacterized protein n=1 Tax=Molorchus minor TaxID=1323400 RepID=A0ABQ9JUG4_9CUCU|nr:hypothetical protein NQ317_009811 [Molorchus minor]